MGNNDIENLMEKYWEGNTSLEEEMQLKAFFSTEEVPAHLQSYQPLFQYFGTEKQRAIKNEAFDTAVIEQLEMPTIVPNKISRRRRLYRRISRVAAIAVLVFGAYFAYEHSQPVEKTDPFAGFTAEEIEAYEQTKAALFYVSAKLNKGTKIAAEGMMKVNTATEKVRK